MSKNFFVEVLLDQNLAKALDYAVPMQMQSLVEVGMRVEVPLRAGLKPGTISAVKEHSKIAQVKDISRLLSTEAELSEPLWKLAQWMSRYYCTPLQKVLRCFLPPFFRKNVKERSQIFLKLAKSHSETLRAVEELRTKQAVQAEVLAALLNANKGLFLQLLLKDPQISRSAVDSLIRKKWITAEKILPDSDLLTDEEFFPTLPKKLNLEQTSSVDVIKQALDENKFSAHLIYGITGSGKTEIYMQAIQTALSQNKSAIMLVPEISLTSQTIERFRARFAEKIAILHHRRSLGERSTAWENLRKGHAKILIGARSAIFSPMQNLGLIIVDEEHDSSYKQSDESPCYQGRDVAVMRAHLENCPVLLGSATPSIESSYNAEIGKYRLHTLGTRAGSASLPSVKIVDMKKAFDIAGGFTHFSGELLDALKERIHAGEQTLLFLNRRGYNRMQMCKGCGHIVKCPHCDLSLTFHRESNHLQCHLCDFKKIPPRECPLCQSPGSLEFKGFGTEHVERTLHAIFPSIRTLRMDRDTTQKKHSHEDLFKQFRAHKADVLIGTQMIAKGFHFPSVTLVGVLNADASLNIPDFRASEQVFQLLTQVAGRSGRSELAGEVIIQTFLPTHPTILLAKGQDYPSFYKAAIEERHLFGYPPFCHLIKVLFSGAVSEDVLKEAQLAHNHLTNRLGNVSQLLPVVPSGHPKIKDQYRFQFLVKTAKVFSIGPYLAELKSNLNSVSLKIDVDPSSTFF
ncbi:MAG: primosomal protein N' [Chlamydiota bacterium]